MTHVGSRTNVTLSGAKGTIAAMGPFAALRVTSLPARSPVAS